MNLKKAQHISPIPYISHTYGDLLRHDRKTNQKHNCIANRNHLKVIVATTIAIEDQIKYKPKVDQSIKP